MSSVKGNIILNGINTISGILFPVITFPYAARVLLPDGIGTVNFLNSIISYIVLITSLGIPMYAVKEIAKYREDKYTRDKVTIEIIILSTILCMIGYGGVWVMAKFVTQIHEQSALFYILSLTIVFTAIGVNWFYQGIEDFKFITIRAIIIRTLSAAALFIFVKDASDILIYGIILVGSTVGNNIINFFYLRKHINLKSVSFNNLNIIRHLKPTTQIFVLNAIISLYVQLNTVMIGFISGEEAVGIYTGGVKITSIAQTMITSIGMVMIPRCSNVLKNGDYDSYKLLITKSLNLTLCIATPLLIGGLILARPIIMIFCGTAFEESIPVFRLDSPLMILSCLSNLIAIQVLFTQERVNLVIKCVSMGAITNVILNIFLIPRYNAAGAAISANIAELFVLSSLLILGHRYLPFKISNIINLKYLTISLSMGLAVFLTTFKASSYVEQLLVGIPIGLFLYILMLYVTRDTIAVDLIDWVKHKYRTR